MSEKTSSCQSVVAKVQKDGGYYPPFEEEIKAVCVRNASAAFQGESQTFPNHFLFLQGGV